MPLRPAVRGLRRRRRVPLRPLARRLDRVREVDAAEVDVRAEDGQLEKRSRSLDRVVGAVVRVGRRCVEDADVEVGGQPHGQHRDEPDVPESRRRVGDERGDGEARDRHQALGYPRIAQWPEMVPCGLVAG